MADEEPEALYHRKCILESIRTNVVTDLKSRQKRLAVKLNNAKVLLTSAIFSL